MKYKLLASVFALATTGCFVPHPPLPHGAPLHPGHRHHRPGYYAPGPRVYTPGPGYYAPRHRGYYY